HQFPDPDGGGKDRGRDDAVGRISAAGCGSSTSEGGSVIRHFDAPFRRITPSGAHSRDPLANPLYELYGRCLKTLPEETDMRHPDFVPQGVIPAVLLPFHEDLSIDEASFRSHLRDVAAVRGLSAITVNAHSTEVASCTPEEQRRVMEIAGEEVGSKL